MTSIKSNGARLSPCLTPVVDPNVLFCFSKLKLMVISLYSFFMTLIVFVGIPYLAKIRNIISLLIVS